MERVELGSVDQGRLIPHEHLATVVERIDHDGASVAKSDLKDGPIVFTPPALTRRCMILTQLEKMTSYRNGSWDLWDTLDERDVGACKQLCGRRG